MKKPILVMAVLTLCGANVLRAADGNLPTYTLGTPRVPILCNATNAQQVSAWARTNAMVSPIAIAYVQTNLLAVASDSSADLAARRWRTKSVVGGFPIERNRPQYYLGDMLEVPANVDWDATYAVYQTIENRDNFLFDTVNCRVYVTLGETSKFKWVVNDSKSVITSEVVVVSVPMSSSRPKNIFWTDKQYGGSPVDLTGKFVKLFGPSNLLTCVYGKEDTGVDVGGQTSYRTIVTSGVYIDEQSDKKSLYAAGRLEGQLVLAYYDSATYERIVDVITVRVSCPVKNVRTAVVGGQLTPDGGGYDGSGLVASPANTDESSDGLGSYVYQHNGQYSYSPKNKAVFALRPTNEKTRNQTLTTWYEIDNQAVQWPFEMDEYRVDWPDDMPLIVRGDSASAPGIGVRIPDGYTAELQKYQEDDGKSPLSSSHARSPANGYFTTVGAGRSLLMLTADDNIWFVPFRSVLRTDASWYDLTQMPDALVGQNITFRGGVVKGLATNRTVAVSTEVPGYVYAAKSSPVWNSAIYSDSGVLDNGVTSAVYVVTASMKDGVSTEIEVWWSSKYQQPDMPSPLIVPTVPQRSNVVWPQESQMPTIAISSQSGSDNTAYWEQGKALVFSTTGTSVPLPSRSFFSPTGGGIIFWTRDYDAQSASYAQKTVGKGALLTLGDTNGVPVITVDYDGKNGFAVDFDGIKINTKPIAASHDWHLFKLSWTTNSVECTVFARSVWEPVLDSVASSNVVFDVGKIAACMSGNCLGAASEKRLAWPFRCIDHIMFFNSPIDNLEAVIGALADKDIATDTGVTLAYFFDDEDELVSDGSAEDVRLIRDHKLGIVDYVEDCLYESPGSPRFGVCTIKSEHTPVIYRQTNPDACGYNPNEEHAFVQANGDRYVVWAMRNDLNRSILNYSPVSRPGVLVSYVQNNTAKMQYFNVAVTNMYYPVFGASCVVGAQIPGPHPFDLFEKPWLPETRWVDENAPQPFRDRKGQVWARAPGEFDILMYYTQQDGFDWPSQLGTPAIGEAVPWLAYADTTNLNSVLTTPKAWHWRVSWPDRAVPQMKIGYTLTAAEYGLPEVWNAKSMAVLYPVTGATEIVELTDPTVARKVDLGFKASTQLESAGLKTGPGEKLIEKQGMYYFRGITATLSDRIYIDPTTDQLVLIGKKENKTAGVNLLFPNVIATNEVASVKALLTTEGEIKNALVRALNALEKLDVVHPTKIEQEVTAAKHREYVDHYDAPDHYALTARGTGALGATNWVVLIENNATNSFCDAGNPINMHLVQIVPEYFTGSVVTREDPNNLLSQILSVHYSQNFAGAADDFEFEWQRAEPSSMAWAIAYAGANAIGLTSFAVGEQGDNLANMVNTYWRCRYRAVKGAAKVAMGDRWSDWSDKGLAEGWVQRCLNNITPYTQRMTDLYNNATETAVTMMRQAGKPYTGDVALNQDNLTSVGLIELYRTILNKAESMSLLQGLDNAEANKQLLLAVERLADLYNVLGDEAYSDAINPTIGFGSNFTEIETGLKIDYGAASSSLFCFDNQVASLLDEELALVRGRDCLANPDGHTSPFFNRLIWNFTKGNTAGEVPYAVNYGISGHRDSTIKAETAAEQYPQGHGDAYGHYLSALQGYYRLLRNPNFTWGEPAMGEMNVADTVVNVDYYDESTFAVSAANVAKAAQKAVELTALKSWRDNASDMAGAGYVDANATNAFGYGEWASRGGYGAFCNWVVANSLLPEATATNDAGVLYADLGLTHIDRGTVPGIAALSDAVAAIERTCDRMDAGDNPLGLDANAVPFDLTPIGDADDATHFEQIRARAGKAFENARQVLDRAQTYANRLKLIQETEAGAIDNLDEMEDNATAQLIAIYGRPYADDIGPSATYPQGYYGPDIYHYMWMNLADYGLTSVDDTMSVTTISYRVSSFDSRGNLRSFDSRYITSMYTNTLSYSLSANGVVVMPGHISGQRPASGELQIAYADFLSAYAKVQQKLYLYEQAKEVRIQEVKLLSAQMSALSTMSHTVSTKNGDLEDYYDALLKAKQTRAALDLVNDLLEAKSNQNGLTVGVIGLASSLIGDASKTLKGVLYYIGYFGARLGMKAAEMTEIGYDYRVQIAELDKAKASGSYSVDVDKIDLWERATAAVVAENTAISEITEAINALSAAQDPITKLIQDARAIEEGRELTRQQYANNIAKLRYNDMFFRKLRNDALAKYDAAFALAQKYTLLAAKAYAYETGSPLESSAAGRELLRAIVGARSLGEVDNDGNPMVSENGDAGLSGILAELDANWANRKTQLGINNPQPYATWFSLRHELFRILPDASGDYAWRTELAKYWVEDIRNDAEFVHHCQPFASQFGLADKEPGLVIPFETTIDFASNLFGKPLAFDDHQFDSTYYATKISAAGVWFEGYNEKRNGYTGASAFSVTPNVYLVPVGTDRMRVPGTDDNGEIVSFDVVDQTIPAPYPLTAAEIAESMWYPIYSGELAGSDSVTRCRRHPSFRAYFGNAGVPPSDAALDATRLVGRSVWNTRWLLIVPAGTLNADRDAALKAFIYGLDVNRDGILDVQPVRDIKIGFRTYAAGGK